MVMRGWGNTDIGKKRERNEDSFLVDNDLGLFVVADGMGGHAGGDVAAAIAIETVLGVVRNSRATLEEARAEPVDMVPVLWLAEDAARQASRAVYQRAKADPELDGMGCTLTVLLAVGDKAVMAHVGDSRLYLVREGRAVQLSDDHTLAQELVSIGLLPEREVPGHHLGHMLTRAIGIEEEVHVDVRVLDILPGDRFLLCSDGLSAYVDDPEWLASKMDGLDSESVPDALIRFANESGGADNVTVVVARVDSDSGSLPASAAWGEEESLKTAPYMPGGPHHGPWSV